MARYPYAEYSKRFMEEMQGIYSPVVWEVVNRRYKRQARDVQELFDSKKIKSSSPCKMDLYDVRALLVQRKALGHSYSEYSKEIAALSNLFVYCDNLAVARCLQKFPLLKPRSDHDRLPPLSGDQYNSLLTYCSIPSSDIAEMRGKLAVLLSMECGLRTYELKLLESSSVDFEENILHLVHVKGEGSYGKSRDVLMSSPVVRQLGHYFDLFGKEKYVFSSRGTVNTGGAVTSNTLRRYKALVEDAVGFTFSYQTCRRTFGQNFLDLGLSVESASLLMGHSSTKTTEYYYARRHNDLAIAEARSLVSKDDPKEGVPRMGIGAPVASDSQKFLRSEQKSEFAPVLFRPEVIFASVF
ncbi:MAG: site-specific integrase [Saccharofermentanales bacterium]